MCFPCVKIGHIHSMKTIIMLPCYNEEITIKKVILGCHDILPNADIWVCDNNSDDLSYKIIQDICRDNSWVHFLEEKRQGKGNAIKKIISHADGDIYLMIDTDDTYDIHDLPAVQDKIATGYDMVLGNRFADNENDKNSRLFHKTGNKCAIWLMKTLYHSKAISDPLTGLRGFSRQFIKNIEIQSEGYELESEFNIYALKNHYKITSVPTTYKNRPDGSFSKLNTVKDSLKIVKWIIKNR